MEDYVCRKMAVNVRYSKNTTSIFRTFHTYFADERFVDLIFICKLNVAVKAHKMVVCAVSDFLKDMIEDSGPGIAYVSLPNISHLHMKLLLSFLYEGELTVSCEELNELQNIIAFLGMFLPDVAAVPIDSTPFVNVNLDISLTNPDVLSNVPMDDPLREPSNAESENVSKDFPELPSNTDNTLVPNRIVPAGQENLGDKNDAPAQNEDLITNDNDTSAHHPGLRIKKDLIDLSLKTEVYAHEENLEETNISSSKPEEFVVPEHNVQEPTTAPVEETTNHVPKQKRDRSLRKMERPLRKSERPLKKKFILIKGKIFEAEFPTQQEFSDSSPDSSCKSTPRASRSSTFADKDSLPVENGLRKSDRTAKKKFVINKGKVLDTKAGNVQPKVTEKSLPSKHDNETPVRRRKSENDTLVTRKRGRPSVQMKNNKELLETNETGGDSVPNFCSRTSIIDLGERREVNTNRDSDTEIRRKHGRPMKIKYVLKDGKLCKTKSAYMQRKELDRRNSVGGSSSGSSESQQQNGASESQPQNIKEKDVDVNGDTKLDNPPKERKIVLLKRKHGRALYQKSSELLRKTALTTHITVSYKTPTNFISVEKEIQPTAETEHQPSHLKIQPESETEHRPSRLKIQPATKPEHRPSRLKIQPATKPEHRPSRLNSFKHKCKHCGKLFMMTDKLKAHMLIHGDTGANRTNKKTAGSNSTDTDTKTKSNSTSTTVVVNGHGGNKASTVRDKKSGKQAENNANHSEKRTKCRYPCNKCEVTCYSRSSYFHHQNLHNRVRPFRCIKCDKAFIRRADLNGHMYVHTNIRPHACNLCEKRFKMKKHLKTHIILLHHKDSP